MRNECTGRSVLTNRKRPKRTAVKEVTHITIEGSSEKLINRCKKVLSHCHSQLLPLIGYYDILSFFFSFVSLFVFTENECQNYKILNTADRSQFHKTSGPGIRCDQNEIDPNSWYRFTGAAGNAMADTCVQPNRCQTMRTGWFDGKYPEVRNNFLIV